VLRPSRVDPLEVLRTLAREARPHVKMVVAVDEDVDPRDMDNLLTAILFRAQPSRDMEVEGGYASFMDFSVEAPEEFRQEFRPLDGPPLQSSTLMVDATRKWPYPPVALPEKRWMDEARALWEAEGLPELRPRPPWHALELGQRPDRRGAERASRGDWMAEGRRCQARQRPLEAGEHPDPAP